MTFSWPNEKIVIHRLRVRASGLDPQAARLRAGFALEAADLRPPGLPPAAVLCVRRLRDPRPGELDLLRPGQPASPRWERAVQEALAELARAAARPAREPVPAGAQAVLFADRAELIACLARDWLDGCLHQRWWWRDLQPDLDPARLVARTWAEAPAFVPAALEQLASCGRAVEFVRALGGPSAWQVLAAVLDFFALPEVKGILESLRAFAPVAPLPAAEAPAPPWQPYVPESRAADLGQVQLALLGIGLIQRRAPQFVRRPGFLEEFRTWCERIAALTAGPEVLPPASHAPARDIPGRPVQAASAQTNGAPARAAGTPFPLARTERGGIHPTEAADRSASESLPGMPEAMPVSPADQELARARLQPAAPPEEQPPRPETTIRQELPGPMAFVPQQESTPDPPAAVPKPPVAVPEPPVTWPEPLAGTWFETGFGGAFYLVNLGLFLGLYADFTRPRTPGIDLPLWDFLALVGRALVGPELEADPLWDWLARLAGRSAGRDPGADFRPPDCWRVPPDWLKPFECPGEWTWSRRTGRLRVDHPAGFRVVDVPSAGEPAIQLEDELRSYEGFVHRLKRKRPGPEGTPPSLDAWLGWLLPYVRKRLRLALGLDGSGDPGRTLCARPARVYLTESHLDVTFPLTGLPLEIRLSGLDRDPGWVPAAGRYVTFRYED